MIQITSEQRRSLRARAHGLNPVVAVSQNGLSDSVLREIDISLKSHELIKIRVFEDDRNVREEYLSQICEKLRAAPVQHIGKLLVVWRPSEEEDGKAAKAHRPPHSARTGPRRTKRSFQGDI
ncbi:YhbY family RNA-binding protein [Propionivibrio soli]|uniref:YhbY family RNA-binding protein n=1 Tax=Propionivibrio soli TaxID=2976531 RepID=UPI0021E700A8|nr:YhbY family RNA-binding protein [Propionivibrio soli]